MSIRLAICGALRTFWPLFLFLLMPANLRAEPPSLIPRQLLFGNPTKAAPLLSPDGRRIAFLAPDDRNILQIWVQTLGKEDVRKVTSERGRGIGLHWWTYSPDTLVYVQDSGGDENYHVYAVNVRTDMVQDLTPQNGVRVSSIKFNHSFPNEALAALYVGTPKPYDVYRINLLTGKLTLDTKNPGDVTEWLVDGKFQVAVAEATTRDGGAEIRHRNGPKSSWKTIVRWSPQDADGKAVGISADGKSLWLASCKGRDTLALVKHDLQTGKEEELASERDADLSERLINPVTSQIDAVAFNRQRTIWKGLDAVMASDIAVLQDAGLGNARFVSYDQDWQTWVISFSADTRPFDYYLYHRPSKQLTHLFSAYPEMSRYTLTTTKPVVLTSRDGLELVSYLTLPVGMEPRNLPLVLLVHGGPWSRATWGYNAETQWLANRGYAVLEVNFRGSTGFGKKFLHAGDRQWGRKMHEDVLDGVAWAIQQRIADPKRIAIFGWSYGGYEALVAASSNPETFACAVDAVGPANLVTFLNATPPHFITLKRMMALRVGDPKKDLKPLLSCSPFFHAERIRVPLLIAQGANDVRVRMAESEQLVTVLRRAHKPVEYLLFPDEGHGFARPENKLKFYAAAEEFLAKYLGGRVETADSK